MWDTFSKEVMGNLVLDRGDFIYLFSSVGCWFVAGAKCIKTKVDLPSLRAVPL